MRYNYLQKFERLLKREGRAGNVEITKKEILTDKTFEVCIDFSFDTLKINIERPVEYA
ncbi:MAG: hypothetical protein HDS62_01890 [Bacteroidales bacterium]|nr:hypothetical protein [Bacteroidales bacterium]